MFLYLLTSLVKGGEDFLLIFNADADAGVGDGKFQPVGSRIMVVSPFMFVRRHWES